MTIRKDWRTMFLEANTELVQLREIAARGGARTNWPAVVERIDARLSDQLELVTNIKAQADE